MQTQHYPRLFLVIVMIFIIGIGLGQAQDEEENLLTNPGFEASFSSGVAAGWQSWIADSTNAPTFQDPPDFFAGATADDRGLIPQVRSGSNSQAYYSLLATHDAGVYQEVSGITPGTELRFNVYVHVFSNNSADLDDRAIRGGVSVRVGIDPDGGTDPTASEIVYSDFFTSYDAFSPNNVIATATGETVTVFVQSIVTEPVQNTVIFLDDAVLNITPESPTPDETEEATEEVTEAVETEEATEEPTEEATEEPTEDPTPTREGETETEEPTDEPTEEPTEEETEPAATDEVTPEPTDVVEPISEDFPGQILHTVRSGDTVGRLAVRYGSSIAAITDANGLDESALIFVGQGLVIPVRIVPATETPSATPQVIVVTATQDFGTGGPVVGEYTVQRGDTLSSIARRFNTTVGTLVGLNGIANPNQIFVGQVLDLPGTVETADPQPTAAPDDTDDDTEAEATEESDSTEDTETGDETPATYVVQPGDNLFRIALRFGVSLTDLAAENNITNFNLIFVGQDLTIPQ